MYLLFMYCFVVIHLFLYFYSVFEVFVPKCIFKAVFATILNCGNDIKIHFNFKYILLIIII